MKNTKEKIEVMQWYEDGNTIVCEEDNIEYNNRDGRNVIFNWGRQDFNMIVEPEYIPYTAEDIDKLEPSKRYIKNDITKERMAILAWDPEDISIFIPERNNVINMLNTFLVCILLL